MTKSDSFNMNVKPKKSRPFLNIFNKNASTSDSISKSSYRKTDDYNDEKLPVRTINSKQKNSVNNVPVELNLPESKPKNQAPQQVTIVSDVYEEIQYQTELDDLDDALSAAAKYTSQINEAFLKEHNDKNSEVDVISETYQVLDGNDFDEKINDKPSSSNSGGSLNNSTKSSVRNEHRFESYNRKQSMAPSILKRTDSIDHGILDNRFKENRSKSIAHSTQNHHLKIEEKPNNLDVRRRTMLDVIKNIDHSHAQLNAHADNDDINLSVLDFKVSPMSATNSHHQSHNAKAHTSHDHGHKRPTKLATGISIVYGIFLFLLGIFLSLDTMAGELGTGRTTLTVFYCIIYTVSILWIIYLFIDIRRYQSKLNNFLGAQHESQKNEIRRDKNGFYGAIDLNTKRKANLYEDRAEILENINKNETYTSKENDKLKSKLVDFTSKRFRGYLIDINQPYNMYLKAGIAAFCIISLMQCCVEVIEGVENSFYGKPSCSFETHDAIISGLQFIFSSLQFLFIFTRGNIVICTNNVVASVLTMHLTITNLIVWFKNILLETIMEYYEHVIEENLELIESFYESKNHSMTFTTTVESITSTVSDTILSNNIDLLSLSSNISSYALPKVGGGSDSNLYDCYDEKSTFLKSFAITLKPYMYPATIEFSITCSTIFILTWYKIGKTYKKNFSLMPTKKNFQGVGTVNMPYSNQFIMLDCTKTSNGLFFGVIIFVSTLITSILFIMYNSNEETREVAKLLSEITEIVLLLIGLIITWLAFVKVRRHYSKVIPETNMFDIALEIFSIFGVYAYSINAIIAIMYELFGSEFTEQEYYLDYLSSFGKKSGGSSTDKDTSFNILAGVASVLQIIQSTSQTLFILECLRRYALYNSPFMRKPARELITALCLTNVSMWLFDTFSAKRFSSKPFLVDHYGILKWSIINAFTAPIAIFYRFHSSVCLSDIWYGLFYGEYEESEGDEENSSDSYEMNSNESKF